MILFLLDSCGSDNNTAEASLTNLKSLTVISNDNIFYPSFSSEIQHYAISCLVWLSISSEEKISLDNPENALSKFGLSAINKNA